MDARRAGRPHRLSMCFSDLLGALCAKTFHTAPTNPIIRRGSVVFSRQYLSEGEKRAHSVLSRVVFVSLSCVSLTESMPFGGEGAAVRALFSLCRRVCSCIFGEVAPLGVHEFEKGALRRSGRVKFPPSCAHHAGSHGVRTIDSLRRSTHLFRYYCCPENFKTAEKYTPKPFSIGLRAFFFKKQTPKIK